MESLQNYRARTSHGAIIDRYLLDTVAVPANAANMNSVIAMTVCHENILDKNYDMLSVQAVPSLEAGQHFLSVEMRLTTRNVDQDITKFGVVRGFAMRAFEQVKSD